MPRTINLPPFVGDQLRTAFDDLSFNISESPNAFSQFKLALSRNQDASLLVWGDSTGNGASAPREWPFLLADKLAATYPSYTVQVSSWNDGSVVWDAPVTIQTGSSGSSSPVIRIWNNSISGQMAQYSLGSNFLLSLRSVPVDGMIINHGHNHMGSQTLAVVRGEFFAAVETYRLYHPNVPISVTLQNPRQDSTLMDQAYQAWSDVAKFRDVGIINVHDQFVARGKPTSLFLNGDTVHPNENGQAIWLDVVWNHFQQAKQTSALPVPSMFAAPAASDVNIIPNGNFSQYTTSPGAPDGWVTAGSGTLTATKDTSFVADNRQGYSVRTIVTGNSGRIEFLVTDPVLTALRGRQVTLAVKRWVDASAAANVGRIQLQSQSTLLGSVVETTRAYVLRQTGWVWWVLSGFNVPSDASTLVVRLFADQATTPSAVPAYFDQVCLVPGLVPRAAR